MDKKHLSVIKRLVIGMILSSLFAQAHALGLGKLRVNSALDEPLDAEIELTSVPEAEQESLTVALASRSDFRRAGVEYPEFFDELTFEVSERAGTPVIKIRSQTPAAEPFLHFLVSVEWSGGKLIREYTALLDPPVYAAETPTSVSSPRVVEDASPQATEPAEEGAMTESVPTASDVGDQSVRFGEYGPVREGETLWGIAAKLQPEAGSVNMFQIMIALLRENPDAFFNNNVNRLKVGEIIKIGDLAAIADISPAEAAVAYQAQLEEWQAYRQQVAAAAGLEQTPAAPAPTEPMAAAEAATGEPTAEAVTAEAAADQDVLRIVQATEPPSAEQPAAEAGVPAPGVAEAEAEIARLNDQVTTLEEALASRELENQELKERVKMLEEQVKNATRLMEIESQELALAQQQAAERQQAAAEQAKAAVKPQAETAPKAAPPAAQPKPQPKPRVTPTPEKAWWENLFDATYDYWTWLLGALAVLLAGAGGLMFVRRRRSLAEFEESILSGSALDTQTETTGSEQTSGATTDTSFLSDFGMTGVGSVEADEVDPLAEAEVYLAYGRDEQAEEVLKEAAQRHPERAELKLKLLEIYQQREDLKSFETLAEELYPAGGKGDPEVWQKVVAMGRKMNPKNPLFSQEMSAGVVGAVAAGAGAATSAAAQVDEGAPTDFADTSVPVDPGLQPFPAPEEDVALDQELEKLANESEAPPPEKVLDQDDAASGTGEVELDSLDFDLDLEEEAASADQPPALVEEQESKPAEDDDTLLDFDEVEELKDASTTTTEHGEVSTTESETDDNLLDLDDIELEPATEDDAEPEPQAAESMPGMDFELADDESAQSDVSDEDDVDEDWDEAATKLDLAKAYIDMGDKAGARSIIDEVMREGNQQQRDQAAQLASQLGG